MNTPFKKINTVKFDQKKLKTVAAIAVVVILLAAAVAFWPKPSGPKAKYTPSVELPTDYMVFVDAPSEESGYFFIAMLSSVVVHNGYHPMWILTPDGTLNEHSAWTFSKLKNKDLPAVVFTQDNSVPGKLKEQGVNVQDNLVFLPTSASLEKFMGYDDWLPVASYEEAIWAAPLAKAQNKVLVQAKKPTFKNQDAVWKQMTALGLKANYTIVTDPWDIYTSQYNQTALAFHVPGLSVVAAEMAAYHDAFVMTDWEPNSTPFSDFDGELNANATGIYNNLKSINSTYGPIEYIALVGTAVSVPQFIFPDGISAEPDGVSADCVYGFLDEEKFIMDAAVGRIINLDIQSASMQIVRTFTYDQFEDTVDVEYSQTGGGMKTINWRTHGSIWNGFEVADQRIQMTPGWFMHEDLPDEGFTYDYVRTTGNEGVREVGSGKEVSIPPIIESSSLVSYRGHGSWHATFYVYEPDSQTKTKGRLEGWDKTGESPSIRLLNIPPQVQVLISCENGKIFGKHFGAADITIEETYSFNYFYAGGVGLIAATEVSFSYIGQDFYSFPEESRLPGIILPIKDGDHNWNLNNAIYAGNVDALIDHEEDHGTIGKSNQWTINRYIRNHENAYTPMDVTASEHWKTVSMYTCLGDPAFRMSPTTPGSNSYDPWHNGADDI